MSGYTKGPWSVVDGYYPGFLKIVGASFEPSIVLVATDLDFKDYCSRTSDAHLMAAGPELIEALESMLSAQYDGDPRRQESCDICIAARSAIAKARGQL